MAENTESRQIEKVPASVLKQRAKMRQKLKGMNGKKLTSRIQTIRGNLGDLEGDAKTKAQNRLRMATAQRQRNAFTKEYGKDWRNEVFGGRKAAKQYLGAYQKARTEGGTDAQYKSINKGNTRYNAALLKMMNAKRKKAGKDPLDALKPRMKRATNYDGPDKEPDNDADDKG
jgi:hypothetical protein